MTIAEKLAKIAENEEKVYEAGKKAQYDDFWDNFQDSGNRTNYNYAFYGWKGTVFLAFDPKYDIIPQSATGMFQFFNQRNSMGTFNLKEFLKKKKIKLDLSSTNVANYLFYYAGISELPELDASNCNSGVNYWFTYSTIESIDKLKVTETTTYLFSFANCKNLTHIIFDGNIGQGIDLSYSTLLDKESIVSVVNALSATASGYTVNFSELAINNAFGGIDNEEWLALIEPKSNWTFAYN